MSYEQVLEAMNESDVNVSSSFMKVEVDSEEDVEELTELIEDNGGEVTGDYMSDGRYTVAFTV